MSYFVRVFSQEEDYPSLYAICEELEDADYVFSTMPDKNSQDFNKDDWQNLTMKFDTKSSFVINRMTVENHINDILEEKRKYFDILRDLPGNKNSKKVEKMLNNTKQIYKIEVIGDISETGLDMLDFLLEFISDATDGYVQIDGQGIYEVDGKLLLEV